MHLFSKSLAGVLDDRDVLDDAGDDVRVLKIPLDDKDVLDDTGDYLWEVLLKVSSRYIIRNLVKTLSVN